MLRRHLGLFAAISAVAISFAACSSDDGEGGGSGGSPDGGGGTTGVDPTEPGTRPPDAPSGPAAAGTTPTVIALYELFVGDTDRSFTVDAQAWKSFGFNLDGILSTKGGTNHCALVTAAAPTVKVDGDGGIDNSFGANLVPIIGALASDLSRTISDEIQSGSFTIMIKLDNMEDSASKPDQTGIPASLYGGAAMDPPPTWTGSDAWPVLPELLNGGNIDDPKVKFPTSYLNGGTWVSGSAGTLNLTVSISGYELALQINKAQIAMDVSGVGSGAGATNGTIAGVIETEQLITELKKIAGNFDQSMCSSSTFDSIALQIRQASDIMADGTNGDANQTCDGISIGLGFTGKAVQLGAVATPAPPPPDPCVDGGAGGAGGTGGAAGAAGAAGADGG